LAYFLSGAPNTLAIRSTTGHAAIPEDGEIPDDVLAWFMRHMAPYLQAIDQSFRTGG